MKILKKYHSFYLKKNGCVGSDLWAGEKSLVSAGCVQELVSDAIREERPFSAGKIGTTEQILLQWAYRIPISLPVLGDVAPGFFQTLDCLTNAGARPRTKSEYKIIASLFRDSVNHLDLLPVFKLAGEKSIINYFGLESVVCGHLDFLPFKQISMLSWANGLQGKKLVIVSPFKDEIEEQAPRMGLVWGRHDIMPHDFEIEVIRFPYLVDPESNLHWRDVFEQTKNKIKRVDADVGLFGCGFMGLLFADFMKTEGKVGLHLGGVLQFLFGIKGRRYEMQPHFAKYINQFWIRPAEGNRPSNSEAIEGGCYW